MHAKLKTAPAGDARPGAKQTSSDLIRLAKANWLILEGRRLRALYCVLLLGAAGISEGSAIMVLVPALKGVAPGGAEMPGWSRLLKILGLPDGTTVALGAFLLLGLLSALLSRLSKGLSLRLRVDVENAIRTAISQSLLDVRWDMFHRLRLGDIGKSVVVEAVQIAACSQLFLQGLGTLLVVLGYMLFALALSPPMTLITILFAGIGAVLFRRISLKARSHADALTDIISDIGVRVTDTFNNLKFLRATGLTQEIAKMCRNDYETYRDKFFLSQDYGSVLRFRQEAAAICFIWIILQLGLTSGTVDSLVMMVFLALFFRMSPRIFAFYDYIFQSRGYMNWFWVWLDRFTFARAHTLPAGGTLPPTLKGDIRFENLTYAFPQAEAAALRDLTAVIPSGSCVAVVGPSGSGKSTFADILLGLLRPTGGRLALDGISLDELDVDLWRRRIGLVLQDSPIFHATVLENIAWGEEPDRARAEEAARKANAWEFVAALPRGLDEVVGEKGSRLSGGQRQRLALARALYRRPWLLLLDEATSALDSESESLAIKTLQEIKGQCTIVILAHQLRTVRMADSILVLERGRLVESGSWQELLTRDGYFSDMAKLQGILSAHSETPQEA